LTLQQSAAQLLDVWLLRGGHTATAVSLGSALLGASAGAIGAFALLRRRALIADAIAHATLPGVAAAFIVAAWLGADGRSLPVLLTGALIAGVLGGITVQALSRVRLLSEDGAMASVLAVFFGAGVVLMSVVQTLPGGGQAGLKNFIFGQAAAISTGEVILAGACAITVLLGIALLFKELGLVCFDPGFARAAGRPALLADGAIVAMLLLVSVVGLQMVGLVMIVALQIIPAAAARFWTDRLWLTVVISAVIGAASCYVGAGISAVLPRTPTGATIVLCAGAVLALSLLAAPRYGVLAMGVRRALWGLRVARSHALRRVAECAEGLSTDAQSPEAFAAAGLTRPHRLVLRLFGDIRLTPSALPVLRRVAARRALALTRAHRWWEQYLVSHARHDPAHADLIADVLEHADNEEFMEQLQAELGLQGAGPMPASPHPLGVVAPKFNAVAEAARADRT